MNSGPASKIEGEGKVGAKKGTSERAATLTRYLILTNNINHQENKVNIYTLD